VCVVKLKNVYILIIKNVITLYDKVNRPNCILLTAYFRLSCIGYIVLE